jgi:uncharacterized protein
MSTIAEKYRALQEIGTISSRPAVQTLYEQHVSEDFGLKAVADGYMLREKLIPFDAFSELATIHQLQPDDFVCIGKNSALQVMQPDQLVFLDTETTGLAGGTGTFAFMIGMALIRDHHLHIKQFFIADPSQEPAMLQAVDEELQAVNGLVTFNGKTYDIPLLQSRMILNRIDWKSTRYAHLDLLHTCRRLWRPFAADGRLQSMEETVLKLYRDNDIAGELIPALYFDSVRLRDPAALKPVFQHNVLDLVSMARLLVKAGLVFRQQEEESLFHRLGVARTFEYLGRFERACDVCVPQENMTSEERWQILLRHSRNLKRLQRYDESAQLLKKLLDEMSRFHVEPYVELIKLYEHRLFDLPAALLITQRVLQNIAIVRELHDNSDLDELQQDMVHRQNRIQNKIKKMQAQGAPCE